MEWLIENQVSIILFCTIIWGIIAPLWAMYERGEKITVKKVVKIIVDEIQEHSKNTGDRSIKANIAIKNDPNVNFHVAEVKKK